MPSSHTRNEPRTRDGARAPSATRLWNFHPDVMLYMHSEFTVAWASFLLDETLVASQVARIQQVIAQDLTSFPEQPARSWEACEWQPGTYQVGRQSFRIRTATSGNVAVRGKRIVQRQTESGSWTSFAFITRAGHLRIWQSHRSDVASDYVRSATAWFNGHPVAPYVRLCWQCNEDSATNYGLCESHAAALPRETPEVVISRQTSIDGSWRVVGHEDRHHFTQNLVAAQTPSIVAAMSDINPEWVR